MDSTLLAWILTAVTVIVLYRHIGFDRILACYRLWFTRSYWTGYNIIEALSWLAKGMVIVPGLVFGLHIWQLYWITLMTSVMLVWVSERKVLPTLIGFNTLWIWLSFMVIARNAFG
jgi:hypothetical protein